MEVMTHERAFAPAALLSAKCPVDVSFGCAIHRSLFGAIIMQETEPHCGTRARTARFTTVLNFGDVYEGKQLICVSKGAVDAGKGASDVYKRIA